MPSTPPTEATARLLIDAVRSAYGIALTGLTTADGGADPRATTWCGTTPTQAYAVRVSTRAAAVAPVVLDLVSRHDVPGVVSPVRTLTGGFAAPVPDRPGAQLTVLPWVEGDAEHTATLSEDQWVAFGRLLRAVHDTDASPVADRLPAAGFDPDGSDLLLARVRRALARATGPDDHAGRELRGVWADASERVDAVQRRLHELADLLRPRDHERVLCHSDPHLGNVVRDRDGALWLIDWDDAVLAPRERDLMFVLGGVIAAAPVALTEQGWFFRGYGPVPLDPELITWFRALRAIEDLALPSLEILEGSPADRAGELQVIRDVLSETGLIAQALSDAP